MLKTFSQQLREYCLKLCITINNPDNFFETLIKTCSIIDKQNESGKLHKLQQNCDQMDIGIIEVETRSEKYKILSLKYRLLYDSSRRIKWSPEDYAAYEKSLQARNRTK